MSRAVYAGTDPVAAAWLAVLLGLGALLAGCADNPPPPLEVTPTFAPKTTPAPPAGATVIGPLRQREVVAAGPAPPAAPAPETARTGPPARIPLKPTAEALSLEQVSLPAFVNEVFSKTLNLTVQIDQRVMTRTDVVTLRTGGQLPSEELVRMAESILAGYGIGLAWDGSVLHIAPEDVLMAQIPEVIRSRALPEMPLTLRPIFQVVDLHQVSAADMSSWLTTAYGAKVKMFPATKAPAVMLFGLPENVRAAVEAVAALDQARLAGRGSLRLSPVYWTARDLVTKLVDVLRAEGYDVAISSGASPGQNAPVMLIPVEANNSLIAFAADPKILAHIRQWAADLDQPGRADPLRSIFVYLVQNTTAASVGQVVQSALGGQARIGGATTEVPLERAGTTRAGTGGAMSGTQNPGLGGASPAAPAPATNQPPPAAAAEPNASPAEQPLTAERGTGGAAAGAPRIVIDQARNALVLIGTAQDYERIRPLLQTLDRAPREALIEVTVAELTLTDQNNLGIDWTVVNRLGGGMAQRFGTGANVLSAFSGSGGLPIGSSGFNYTLINGVGDVRAILNAFAQNNRVSVLSTPRVLAKSGSVAHIEVGTDVPVITSQGSTNTIQNAGTTGILQSIDYRKTGILLNVRPIIHSGNRIDLNVSQEVSQALPNSTPGISSPLIQTRNISTDLTLGDGQTVVIGGLIAENRSAGDAGIPYLKDIPGVGQIFRSQSVHRDRTELMVFITPYVISGDADAAAITAQFRDQMKAWPVPGAALRW